MSLSHLENIAPVYGALQNGQLTQLLQTFTDDQLRPFLPFLVSTAFGPGVEPITTLNPLLSRLASFQRESDLLTLVQVEFPAIQSKVRAVRNTDSQSADSFNTAPPAEKFTVLLGKLKTTEYADNLTHSFISEDLLEAAGSILALAFIHIPDVMAISTITEKLVSLTGGAQLMTAIVCNVPSMAQPVLHHLSRMTIIEETGKGRNRALMINSLLSVCPSLTGYTVNLLSKNKRDALLSIRLCVQRTSDQLLTFMCSQLVDKGTPVAAALHKSSNAARAALVLLNEKLMQMIAAAVKSRSSEPNAELILCVCLIQLRCNLKFSPGDAKILIDYLCRTEITNSAHLVMALCALLALPVLTQSSPGMAPGASVDPKIVEFLQWLKARSDVEGVRGASERALLLSALCLWGNKQDELNKFLSDKITAKITLHARHFSSLRAIFNTVISERDLAALCATLPVTNGLKDGCNETDLLPVQWILELLGQNVFTKQGVDIAPWIEQQIAVCSLPVHSAMADVLDKFAVSSADSAMEMSVSFVEETFAGPLVDKSLTVRRVLVCAYLLGYRFRFMRSGRMKANPFESVYRTIPLRYILSVVETRNEDFSNLRVSVVRHAVALYPYMLPTTESILLTRETSGCGVKMDNDRVKKILCGNDTIAALRLAHHIENAPISDLVRIMPVIISSTRSSLSPSSTSTINIPSTASPLKLPTQPVTVPTSVSNVSQPLTEALARLWLKLEAIVPRLLIEQTILVWMDAAHPYRIETIYEQPLLVFGCDRRIFALPPYFECLIRMVSFFFDVLKTEAQLAVAAANTREKNSSNPQVAEERDVLSCVYDHSQRAAVVQMLIEICDGTRNKMVDCPARLAHIRSIAFDHIHSMFIKDGTVMRLVVLQTFSTKMVRTLVEGVPSLHVAQNYVQEMLSFPDLNRRTFGVVLTVELFRKYRVMSTFPVVQLMLNAVFTFIRYAKCTEVLRMMERAVPALGEVARTYPQLSGHVMEILSLVGSMAQTRLAMNATSLMRKKVLEQRLLVDIEKEIKQITVQTSI